MPASLYTKYLNLNADGETLYAAAYRPLAALMSEYIARGFSPREIGAIFQDAAGLLTSSESLRYGMRLRKGEKPPKAAPIADSTDDDANIARTVDWFNEYQRVDEFLMDMTHRMGVQFPVNGETPADNTIAAIQAVRPVASESDAQQFVRAFRDAFVRLYPNHAFNLPEFALSTLTEEVRASRAKLRGDPQPPVHKLGCDEYHAHRDPDCCASDCWCRASSDAENG